MPVIINSKKKKQQKDILTENSLIDELNQWENSIYLIAEQDYVHGGKDGYDNVPHAQLANRTQFLKSGLDLLKTVIESLKTKIATQDGKNAQEFLEIRNIASRLRLDLDELTKRFNTADELFTSQIAQLRKDVEQLFRDLRTHTHNYAGSDQPSGDANTVKVVKNLDVKAMLVGVTGSEPNKLVRNENVFIQNNELTASRFHGNLNGASETANRFTSKVTISFYGDVIASYLFDGSERNMQVKTSLKTSGVNAGIYGINKARQLQMNETFTVPRIQVNEKGILTRVDDISLTLPSESVSGTTNATNIDGKLYIIGGKHQKEKEFTYSQKTVYMNDGKLYSNEREVVNVSDKQELSNKTYNGYTLAEACSHDVDYSIQGKNNSKDLVTSNALFNHTHKYAGSDVHNGSANGVKVSKNNTDRRYIVVHQGGTDKLEYNTNAHIENNDFTCPVVHATDMLHIPGGKLWIDTSANAIDGSGFNPQTLSDIAYLKEELNKLKEGISSGSKHSSVMAKGEQCVKGDILYYSVGGYRKADNRQPATSVNIVMALTDSDKKGRMETVQSETIDLSDMSHDGETVFLGENGHITFEAPKKTGTVVKVLGYMERSTFVFNSFGSAFVNK